MKAIKWSALILGILLITYLVGPKVASPDLTLQALDIPQDPAALEAFIRNKESQFNNIKPDNESRIVWVDSTKRKTPYSLVYLHGWSASQKEGDPTHKAIAQRYGMNLYLPRLAGHGLNEEEPMLNLTATDLLRSAHEAVAIGKQLGEKVILMTTSTGGTLGLYLASLDDEINSLILYSPNVDMKDQTSHLLDDQWGLQIARMVMGGDYYYWEIDSARMPYWTNKYRLEALLQLRELVDATMTEETFSKVDQPVFLGYYYKNKDEQDGVVSVEAMLKMYDQLDTPEAMKMKLAFPEAGAHVIGSTLTSEDVEGVIKATEKFLEEKVGLKPKD